MTLFSFSDVAVDIAANPILRDVSFTVARGERWGVVGRNGAGKTTLFRLITGDLAPTRGTVSRAPAVRTLLLDQHRDFGSAATVWDAAARGYAEVIELERRIAESAGQLERLGDAVTEADLARYGRDQERFAHLGGWDYHARVDAVLQGLGFDPVLARERPLATLSGGERGRVGLAAPLAAPADLLLLDEPTNHLDLDTIAWLSRYLRELDATVLVISHDRAFLDDIADHVLHVHAGTTRDYRGGYSAFVHQRAERELSERRAWEQQRAFIAKEEDYIRRNIAGQNTAQAKGRRKRLARLPRLSPPPGEPGAMSLRLEAAERGGDRVAEVEGLTLAAGGRTLVRDATATVLRGDVIALVGPNGAGKSTLLAALLNARPPDGGAARIGQSIRAAWFRQDQADVPLDRSVFDVIHDLRPGWNRGQVQGHLGAFGFGGDDVQRSTATLSGGERARLALAMITLARANFLVLDEPTNHLDVESIEVLEDAIEDYDGTVLLVSHDRAFLRELASRVWVLEDGGLTDYQGTFVEWERHREDRSRAGSPRPERRPPEPPRANPPSRRPPARNRRALEQRAHDAEHAVEQAEERVAALEAALADPALYDGSAASAARASELGRELALARGAVDAAIAAWTEAAQAAEAHRSRRDPDRAVQ